MQSIRIDYFADVPGFYCMFCGSEILSENGDLQPCSHTLFVATDDGYEYLSESVREWIPDVAVDIEENDDADEESFSDRLKKTDGPSSDMFFIESYGAPIMPGGMYMGFGP